MSDQNQTDGQLLAGYIVSMDVKIVPKWWQFWKKPHIEGRQFTVANELKNDQSLEWTSNHVQN